MAVPPVVVGTIVRLQVQETSLKVGQQPRRRYDLGGLRIVSEVEIEPGGGWRLMEDGARVMDVHHRDHPASKYRDADGNGLSFGFTAHYDEMRRRFGPHLADGDAAENILVASDRGWTEADLAGGVAIVTATGGRFPLGRIVVATPCVEFARFALRFPDEARPDRAVSAALLFLNEGMRGFYATYAGLPAQVRVGDRVVLAS